MKLKYLESINNLIHKILIPKPTSLKSKVPGLVDALNNRLHRHHREIPEFSREHL